MLHRGPAELLLYCLTGKICTGGEQSRKLCPVEGVQDLWRSLLQTYVGAGVIWTRLSRSLCSQWLDICLQRWGRHHLAQACQCVLCTGKPQRGPSIQMWPVHMVMYRHPPPRSDTGWACNARTEACGTPLVARSLLPGTGSQTGHCFGVTDGRSKGALNSDCPLSTCQMRRPKRPLWGGKGRYREDVGAHRSLGSWLSVRLGLGVLVPSAHVSPGAGTRSHKEHNLPAVHAGTYAIPKWHPCPSHIPPQCTCIPCSTHTLHIPSPPLHIGTLFLLQPRKWGKEAEARQWLQDGVTGALADTRLRAGPSLVCSGICWGSLREQAVPPYFKCRPACGVVGAVLLVNSALSWGHKYLHSAKGSYFQAPCCPWKLWV